MTEVHFIENRFCETSNGKQRDFSNKLLLHQRHSRAVRGDTHSAGGLGGGESPARIAGGQCSWAWVHSKQGRRNELAGGVSTA